MDDDQNNPYQQAADTQEAQADLYVDDDTPLDDEEIEEAKVIIAKNHPLANTPIHQAFPTMGGCIKCLLCCVNQERRKQRMQDLRKLINDEKQELDNRMQKVFDDHGIVFAPEGQEGKSIASNHFKLPDDDDDERIDYDPYGQLGYGFEAYFSSMNIFGWVFLIMTFLMLPALCYYVKWEGLKTASHGYYNSMWMLGNFGFNRQICVSDYVELTANRVLGCEIGVMTELKYVGLIPNDANANNTDLMPYGYCGAANADLDLQDPDSEYTLEYCSEHYIKKLPHIDIHGIDTPDPTGTYLNKTFMEYCYKNSSCLFTMRDHLNKTNDTNPCNTNPAKIYMQYFCVQSRGELNSKREQGLFISCAACFTAIFFLVVVWYLQKTNDLDFMKWDIDNLTCSDFTVEYAISEDMWTLFNVQLNSHSQLPNGGSAPEHIGHGLPVVTMEAFLEHYLTRKLNRCPRVIEDVEIRVANITFAFANEELLGLLKKRGALVAKGKFSKIPELNQKIQKLCLEKKAEYTRPVTAFITFERQEGKDRALKYFDDPKAKRKIENVDDEQDEEAAARGDREAQLLEQIDRALLGRDIICYSASEPSDIIWENRHVTVHRRNINKMITCCISTLFLIGMFYFFIVLKAMAVRNMYRYPSTTNCDSIESIFENQMDIYQEYAELDKNFTNLYQGTGIYYCYCKNRTGSWIESEYGFPKDKLCRMYWNDYGGGEFLSTAISVVITIVNMIIAVLVQMMVKEIGYWTVTAEISAIMVTIFIATFFNTAVLLLLADANTSQVLLLSWVPSIQKGPFPDLTEEWYVVIAPSLILTMFLNALSPCISLASAFATSSLSKCLDQGCSTYCCCKPEKTTKCKTIQEYVNIYGGPAHVMAPKYSALMNTVCVTMMYGVAIPELFLIAALTFCLYYICERLTITYYYTRPPMYDDRLNKTSLELMKFGPLIMCFFGYWCMGNMQIFQAKLTPLVNQATPIVTNHEMYPTGDQALPLFIVGLIMLLGLIFTDLFSSCLKKMKIMEETPEFIVDEHLGTYFECIPIWGRKSWLAQETHSVQKLGIATMGEWTRQQLATSKSHELKTLKNAPNYEIICNPEYVSKFQFTPIEMCDTPEEQAVSDVIMKVMYLGYTRQGHQEFDFEQAIHDKVANKRKAKKEAQALNE